MARLNGRQGQDLDPLLARFDRLSTSPLSAIPAELRPLLEMAQKSHGAGQLPTEAVGQLAGYKAHLLAAYLSCSVPGLVSMRL